MSLDALRRSSSVTWFLFDADDLQVGCDFAFSSFFFFFLILSNDVCFIVTTLKKKKKHSKRRLFTIFTEQVESNVAAQHTKFIRSTAATQNREQKHGSRSIRSPSSRGRRRVNLSSIRTTSLEQPHDYSINIQVSGGLNRELLGWRTSPAFGLQPHKASPVMDAVVPLFVSAGSQDCSLWGRVSRDLPPSRRVGLAVVVLPGRAFLSSLFHRLGHGFSDAVSSRSSAIKYSAAAVVMVSC